MPVSAGHHKRVCLVFQQKPLLSCEEDFPLEFTYHLVFDEIDDVQLLIHQLLSVLLKFAIVSIEKHVTKARFERLSSLDVVLKGVTTFHLLLYLEY